MFFFFRKGLTVFFWVILDVPNSNNKYVTVSTVRAALYRVLASKANNSKAYIFDQYYVDRHSLNIYGQYIHCTCYFLYVCRTCIHGHDHLCIQLGSWKDLPWKTIAIML